MKKFLLKVGLVWLVSILVIGWVYLFSKTFEWNRQMQIYLIAFVLAPLSETLLYVYVPYKLALRFERQGKPSLVWPLGILANFFFIAIHINNYPFAGQYWAFAIQGVLGFACYYLQTKVGYLGAVALHIKYNIAVKLLLS